LSAAQRRGGGKPEQYAPDATRVCMENASLNTGANCKRYVCTVLHNAYNLYQNIQKNILFLTGLVIRRP
jgi:hypothetical protein